MARRINKKPCVEAPTMKLWLVDGANPSKPKDVAATSPVLQWNYLCRTTFLCNHFIGRFFLEEGLAWQRFLGKPLGRLPSKDMFFQTVNNSNIIKYILPLSPHVSSCACPILPGNETERAENCPGIIFRILRLAAGHLPLPARELPQHHPAPKGYPRCPRPKQTASRPQRHLKSEKPMLLAVAVVLLIIVVWFLLLLGPL